MASPNGFEETWSSNYSRVPRYPDDLHNVENADDFTYHEQPFNLPTLEPPCRPPHSIASNPKTEAYSHRTYVFNEDEMQSDPYFTFRGAGLESGPSYTPAELCEGSGIKSHRSVPNQMMPHMEYNESLSPVEYGQSFHTLPNSRDLTVHSSGPWSTTEAVYGVGCQFDRSCFSSEEVIDTRSESWYGGEVRCISSQLRHGADSLAVLKRDTYQSTRLEGPCDDNTMAMEASISTLIGSGQMDVGCPAPGCTRLFHRICDLRYAPPFVLVIFIVSQLCTLANMNKPTGR